MNFLKSSLSSFSRSSQNFSYTLENTGNDLDGLMVSLNMNVISNFGLIPPSNAIYDSSENIRYFELRDIEPNENITFSAFATTPRGLEMNGTAKLEVTVQSILLPNLNFSITEDISYLGEEYRTNEIENKPNAFSEIFETGFNFLSEWNGLILTVIVVGIGSIMLNRALVKRQEDMEKYREKLTPKQKETVEDWSEKFNKSNVNGKIEIESEKIDSETFKNNFISKSPVKSHQSMEVDEELIDAATFILDHHTQNANLKDADLLANDLIQNADKVNLGKELMPNEKTQNIIPVKKIGKQTKSQETTGTDFDLDL